MSALLPPVTLTTDFGTSDHYVAQMKGVLLRLAPGTPIVDVTHDIPPQNVRRAAWIVDDLPSAFPPGTIHVVVVDPGVGSSRSILAVASRGQFFIAPDNGLLSLIFESPATGVVLPAANDGAENVSSTFHGRDLMIPAAAHLALGRSLTALGPLLDRAPVRLTGMKPVVTGDGVEATIVWVDRFGNAISNLRYSSQGGGHDEGCAIEWMHGRIVGVKRCYSDASAGEPLALVGSSGYLEIAINGGHAADRLGLHEGDAILIRPTAL